MEKFWCFINRKIFKKVNDDVLVEILKFGFFRIKKVMIKKVIFGDDGFFFFEMMIKREVVKY